MKEEINKKKLDIQLDNLQQASIRYPTNRFASQIPLTCVPGNEAYEKVNLLLYLFYV
jgi:hypothetical protein